MPVKPIVNIITVIGSSLVNEFSLLHPGIPRHVAHNSSIPGQDLGVKYSKVLSYQLWVIFVTGSNVPIMVLSDNKYNLAKEQIIDSNCHVCFGREEPFTQ